MACSFLEIACQPNPCWFCWGLWLEVIHWMLETVRCLKLTPISIKQELKGQWEPTVIIDLSWWSPLTSLYRFSSKYGYVDTYNNHEHTSKIDRCMTQPENSNIGIFRIPEELSLDILSLHVNEPHLLCFISKHTIQQKMVPWYSPYEVLGSYNKNIFVGRGQYTIVA